LPSSYMASTVVVMPEIYWILCEKQGYKIPENATLA